MVKRFVCCFMIIVMLGSVAFAGDVRCFEWMEGIPKDPIKDLMELWHQKEIWIILPTRSPAVKNDEKERFLYRIDGRRDYCLICDRYADDSKMFFVLQTPYAYRPARDMGIIVLSYFLQITEADAADLYDSMVYNMIDGAYEGAVGTTEISILRTRYSGEILSITVYRDNEQGVN